MYVGWTVLELSKLAMYKFYCGFVKKKCKNPILLFTDTDSLCFETAEHFYEIMLNNKEFFDLSNFPKDSKYFCNDKMGECNEYGGTAIYKFIGRKSKMYSIYDINNCEKVYIRGIVQILNMMNLWILYLIKKLSDIIWVGLNHLIIECILMKVIRYLYPLLIIKDIFLMME